MKKLIKFKTVSSLLLATTVALAATSCGGNNANVSESPAPSEQSTNVATDAPKNEIEKPDVINAFVDTTFGSQVDPTSWQPWSEKYEELTGIKINFTKPVHNEYFQKLSLAFTTGDIPDLMQLGSTYYPTYANNGALWDMTAAWENSDLKASGILDEQFVEGLKLNGALYGFPETRGNGTVTYVRQDWLDKLGMKAPTNYAEYIDMLKAFTNDDPDGNGKKDTFGVTMPGLVSPETPFTMYTREFYHNAEPGFYQKADGTWVDGMLEPEMVDALQRMRDAYAEGLIDLEVVTNKTSTCRDKFYAGQVGAFNYWAGGWNRTLQSNLEAQNPNGVVVPIPAITETNYIERPSGALSISTAAKNPEGIFKYLIEYSHDGGEGQLLFTRGVEGVHYTVENGVYTQLPDAENPKKLFEKSWYAPELTITKWEDPFKMDDLTISSLAVFAETSEIAPVPTINDTIATQLPDLLTIRDRLIASIVTGEVTVADGIAQYEKEGKVHIDAILASLK